MLSTLLFVALIGVSDHQAAPPLSDSERQAAFTAAGFVQRDGAWRSDCDDPGTPSYSPGEIDPVGDLNGDGQPEAVIVEGGTYCYGMTGQGYWLMSRGSDGAWRRMASGTGILRFLPSRGADGWPDMEIGGPGFCFPIHRFDGKTYARHRLEYEGKPCQP